MSIDFDTPQLHATIARDAAKAIHKQAAKLADPPKAPPTAPRPLPTAQPRAHNVVAWRHDGEVRKTAHPTKEAALGYAQGLHYAIVYKYMVMCGREMIARQLVSVPS